MPAERVDPRVVLLCVLAFVTIQAATPIEEWPRFVGYGALLLAAVLWSRVSVAWLLKRLCLALPFLIAVATSALVVRPSAETAVRLPGLGVEVSAPLLVLLGSVAAKATLSIIALSLPVTLWDFPTLLRALQSLRVPRLFVMLMGFMWRYVYLLGDEARRMVQAREARGSWGALARRVRVTGAMTGSLFLRGYERAERVGQAMVARGYDGRVRLMAPLRRLRVGEAAGVVVVAAALCAMRLA